MNIIYVSIDGVKVEYNNFTAIPPKEGFLGLLIKILFGGYWEMLCEH